MIGDVWSALPAKVRFPLVRDGRLPTKPSRGLRSMDVVSISGKQEAKRQDSYMGKSGYNMDAFKIEPYVTPPQ